MLQKYNESDFNLMDLEKSRFSFLKKIKNIKSPFLLDLLKKVTVFFHFCNIMNIENFFIQRYFLVLWLFLGNLGQISKFKSDLRLGKYYYHFLIKYELKKRKFFQILSFFLDDFLGENFNEKTMLQVYKNILVFSDLQLLTNKKLAKGVFFHRITQKLFLRIQLKKNMSKYYWIYLNNLKLHVI